MKTKYIYAIFCLLALWSCLNDEGNYDYLELNEVQSITGIEESYSMTKIEDTLRINPEILFKLEDDSDYEYEWTLSYWVYNDETKQRDNYEVLVSQERDLEFVADHRVPYDDLFGMYRIKNVKTGVVYTHSFKVRVQNAYQYGYFFLCKKNTDSELFLIRENGKEMKNLYETLTGNTLKGKPYCMEDFMNGIDHDLVIFTSEGPDYGAVINFADLDYKWPAVKCFHEENTGEEMVVNHFAAPSMGDIYTIVNGNYYFTGRMAFGDYKPYIGTNVPDLDEKCDYVDQLAFGLTYVHGTNPGTLYAPGNWGAISEVTIDGEPLVLPGNCMFMAAEPGGSVYGSGVDSHVFVKEDDGTVTECVFTAKMDFSTWSNAYTLKLKTNFVAPELITDETKFVNSYSERYFYFSSENKIYRYNYDAPEDTPTLIAELPNGQNISYMYLDYTQEGYTRYDDKFIISSYDNSGTENASIYFVNMDGTIDMAYEHVCGKIVDMTVKK